jgi:hypothetical protein
MVSFFPEKSMTDCSIITTMPKFSLSIKSFVFVLILINVFLSAWYVINGDIVFHTDIARDFLVLQDIVETHKPTLIGPRSGGISGVFHGGRLGSISIFRPLLLAKEAH